MSADKIAALLKQAAGDDVQVKLARLIEAWRLKPAPELAAAIESVAVPPAGLLKDLVWGVVDATSERVAAVAHAPRDPRLAASMQKLLERIPWGSLHAHRRVYKPAFEALVKHADPRTLQWLAEVGDRWTVDGNTRGRLEKSRLWAERQLRRHLEGADLVLTEAEVDLIAEAVGHRTFRPSRSDEEARLLAQIYAHPGDDGPRGVYSDLLLERAEPWGELIALQLTKDLSPQQRERLTKLQATHWRRWCGTLTPYLHDPVFRRGFLSGAMVLLDQRTLPPAGSQWATFEDLAVSAPDHPTDAVLQWCAAVRPHLTRLRSLRGAPAWLGDALLPEGALALEELIDCSIDWLTRGTRTLPKLRRAVVALETAAGAEALAVLGQLPALREVSLSGAAAALVPAAVIQLSASTSVGLVSMYVDGCSHALSRGFDGELSELWTGTGWARRNAELWAVLPDDALTRVALSHDADRVEARRWFAKQSRLERIDVGFSASYATGGGPCGTPAQLRAAEGHWVVVSNEGLATLYDPRRLRPLLQRRLGAADDGKWVVSPLGTRIATETGSSLTIAWIGSHDASVDLRQMRPIGFSDDGLRLWCADGDLTTCIELATRQTLYTVRAPHRTLAIDSGAAVILVDALSGRTTVCGPNPEQPLRVLDGEGGKWAALSATGRLVTLDGAGQVRIADGLTGPLMRVGAPVEGAQRVAVSPDGRKIAAGRTLLDAATGSAVALTGAGGPLDFTADGRLVCATADGPRVC